MRVKFNLVAVAAAKGRLRRGAETTRIGVPSGAVSIVAGTMAQRRGT